MIEKLKSIYLKYKEFILYAICGVGTTLANLFTFIIFTKLFGEEHFMINNALAWFAGVVVAFVTNKIYVFNSKSWELKVALKEFGEFVVARLLSFGFEEGGMLLFVGVLKLADFSFSILFFEVSGQLIIKILLSIVVVILNYFFSKFIIFKKNNKDK